MSQEITKPQTLEQRVGERIREDIGKLMTDEDLKKMVDAVMQDVFFKPRKVDRGYHSSTEPPLVHEILKNLLEKEMHAAVSKWLLDNGSHVRQIVKEVVELGAGMAVVNAIKSNFAGEMYNLEQSILQRFQQ